MQIPDWLAKVFLVTTGETWPEADEDRLRALASQWREFGESFSGLARDMAVDGHALEFNWSGRAQQAFADEWARLVGSGSLEGVVQASLLMADYTEKAWLNVDYAKKMIIGQLAIVAATIASLVPWLVVPGLTAVVWAKISALQVLGRWIAHEVTRRLAVSLGYGLAWNLGTQVGLDVAVQTQQIASGGRHEWDTQKTGGAAISAGIGMAVGSVLFALAHAARVGSYALAQVLVGGAHEWVTEYLADKALTGRRQGVNDESSDNQWAPFTAGAFDTATEMLVLRKRGQLMSGLPDLSSITVDSLDHPVISGEKVELVGFFYGSQFYGLLIADTVQAGGQVARNVQTTVVLTSANLPRPDQLPQQPGFGGGERNSGEVDRWGLDRRDGAPGQRDFVAGRLTVDAAQTPLTGARISFDRVVSDLGFQPQADKHGFRLGHDEQIVRSDSASERTLVGDTVQVTVRPEAAPAQAGLADPAAEPVTDRQGQQAAQSTTAGNPTVTLEPVEAAEVSFGTPDEDLSPPESGKAPQPEPPEPPDPGDPGWRELAGFGVHPDGYVTPPGGRPTGPDEWRAFGPGAIEPASWTVMTPHGHIFQLPQLQSTFQFALMSWLANEKPIPARDLGALLDRVIQAEVTALPAPPTASTSSESGIGRLLDPRRGAPAPPTASRAIFDKLPDLLKDRFTSNDFDLIVSVRPETSADSLSAETYLKKLADDLDLPAFRSGPLPGGAFPPGVTFEAVRAQAQWMLLRLQAEVSYRFVPAVITDFVWSDNRIYQVLGYPEATIQLLRHAHLGDGRFDVRRASAYLDRYGDVRGAVDALRTEYFNLPVRVRGGPNEPPHAGEASDSAYESE